MIRQQRRFESREAEKELAKLRKHRNYNSIMDGSFLKERTELELDQLKEGIHPNEKLQNEFKFNIAFVKTVIKLQAKVDLLRNNVEQSSVVE
jgi:hypothetical protein